MSAPPDARCRPRAAAFCILHFAFCIAVASCGVPKAITLPSDPGAPLSDFASVQAQVSSACAGVRTLRGELGLSGRAGDERVRGRVHVGFERPSSMRLEGVAPFGPPAFILAGRGDSATLVLQREERIVRNAPPEAILEALTGVSLGPADLLAAFTGCVLPSPRPTAGRVHSGDRASIDIESADQGQARRATLFLKRSGSRWQLYAARRDRWQIEYAFGTGMFPQSVRLVSLSPDVPVNIATALAEIETNVDIDPAAFTVQEQKNLEPLTLEELRQAGPLRGQ
jgi:hypothetical protein